MPSGTSEALPAGTWLTRRLPEPAPRHPGRVRGRRGGRLHELGGRRRRPARLPVRRQRGLDGTGVVPNARFYGVVVSAFSVAANGAPEQRARMRVLGLAMAGGVTAVAKGV
ncbi:hypothetical protein OV320_6267 [Actinobacteria bacterium OV320]|nr:hypothetical protein OV320_6267 [Actinobacteria bacterium OV320]